MAWLGTWANRVKISVDNTKVDEALSDFPLTLVLSTASGIGDVDVSAIFDELTSDANRKKIAVTTSDGTTQCYVEIELWDDANETAVLHVKVPSVSDSAATDFYLYYDAAQSDNTTYVGDTGSTPAQTVWDSNFVAVYHMAQDPNGDAASAIKDSTSNGNDGTPAGSMTTADLVTGKVGKGIDFDGTDDRIVASLSGISDFPFTLEGVAKRGSSFTGGIVNVSDVSETNKQSGLSFINEGGAGSDDVLSAWNFNAGSFIQGKGTVLTTTLDFAYGVGVFTNTTDKDVYTNGGDVVAFDTSALFVSPDTISIGSNGGSSPNGFCDGIICEVRISNTARSAAWIKATYNSLWDSLVTFAFVDVTVQTTTVSLTLTPYAATVFAPTVVNATTAALTLTTYYASVNSIDVDVAATLASLNLATYEADVNLDVIVSATSQSLTLTTYSADATLDVEIEATTATLTLTPIDAQVILAWSASETAAIYETLSLAYGKTVTSTAAITDEVTADLGLHVTEWLGAKDTVDSQWAGVETLSETLMLVALSIQQKLYRETVAESAACAETLTPEVSILVKEWLNAVDTVASTFTGTMTISEALRAVDEAIAQRLYQSTVEETMAAADVATAGKIVRAVIAVTGAIADTASDSYIANPAIVEAMSLIDAVADKFMPLETVQETFAAVATVLETPYFNNIVTESWTLADTIAFAWSDTVTESLSVVDSLSLKWTAILSITEALIATETVFGQLEYSDSIAEALSLVDAVLVNQILGLAITEILEAGVTVRLADESWEAWVINTNKFFPSVYSNYEFDSYAVYGNAAFGCKDDGVYELSGATDNGTTIQAGIVLPETSFGTSREKRFRKAYFGISGTSPAIRMETDNGSETYTISNDKANIGRNLKGKEWVLKVASFDSLDFVELVQIILTR